MRLTHLQIKPGMAAPLNPAQRKFNQLVAKIEVLRERLGEWQRLRPLLAQAHGQRIRPLLRVLHGKRIDLADRLEQLLTQPGWAKGQRGTLRAALCELLADLIEDEDTDDTQAARLKALYDQHAEVDYDTENQESVRAIRDLIEESTGLDLGDGAFASEDELLRHARQRLHEHDEAEAERRATRRSAKTRKPQTPAQQRREQEEQAAALSLREIYRKLASALHPDRAADEPDRSHRTAMMKRVNEANDAKDLLALFSLQLEIEQVDAAHIAHASAERARMYNKLLADQAAALQAEIEGIEMSVRLDYLLDPLETVHPQHLMKFLDQAERELRGAIVGMDRELVQLAKPASAKRWLRQRRDEQKLLERFGKDVDCPF